MEKMQTLADARERMSGDFEIIDMLVLMAVKRYGVSTDVGDLIYDDVMVAAPHRLLDSIVFDAAQRMLQP